MTNMDLLRNSANRLAIAAISCISKPMKKGFTLVELSIVLVIIGLLIGGILVGQSLIESAKINKVVKEFQQYEIAVAQFKLKFKYLPGDHPFGHTISSLCTDSTTCRGNADGKIYKQVNPPNHLEARNVWYHLQGTKFLNLKLPFTTTGIQHSASWVANDNFPESSYAKGAAIMIGSRNSSNGLNVNTNPADTLDKIVIHIAKKPDESGFLEHGGFMKPANALALDQKIDDGIAKSGNFYADHGIGGSPMNCFVGDNTTNAIYDLTYTDDDDGCKILLVLNNL